nr:myb/SANT-like DNA-binding domain-containing protein 3 [Onthophagus taurus]
MEPKRTFMSADEKRILLDLVGKYNDIECKKSDCVSTSKKKKSWENLTEEYNSMAETTFRTLEQLRKCWENIKARRKKELAAEKKARMATGGGLFVPIPDDDAVDAVLNAVDIELSEAIDSETCTAGGSTEYNLDRNNVLQPVVVEQGSSPEPSKCLLLKVIILTFILNLFLKDTPTVHHRISVTPRVRSSRGKVASALEEEAEMRLKRLRQQRINDNELHKAQMKEIEERRQQAAELHEINKEKLKLEIELLKKEINK